MKSLDYLVGGGGDLSFIIAVGLIFCYYFLAVHHFTFLSGFSYVYILSFNYRTLVDRMGDSMSIAPEM